VPLIADLRGIQTRYGWISDLLNILDAPFENLVNANYFALPQVKGQGGQSIHDHR